MLPCEEIIVSFLWMDLNPSQSYVSETSVTSTDQTIGTVTSKQGIGQCCLLPGDVSTSMASTSAQQQQGKSCFVVLHLGTVLAS